MGTTTINRNPRGSVAVRRNECTNPSFEADTYDWSYSWFGNGAGNNTRGTDNGYSGTGYIHKTFTSTSTESGDIGFIYNRGWSGDYTEKTASAYIRISDIDAYARVSLMSYNKDGGLINRQDGNPQYVGPNQWARISETLKTPPGTTNSTVAFWLVSGRYLGTGFRIDLDAVQIEPGKTAYSYFDGSTYANGYGTLSTGWDGTPNRAPSVMYDADPATIFNADAMLGYSSTAASLNILNTPIQRTTPDVSLRPAGPRTGTTTLGFSVTENAIKAYNCLRGAGTFTLQDTAYTNVNMNFVISGNLVMTLDDETRQAWTISFDWTEV